MTLGGGHLLPAQVVRARRRLPEPPARQRRPGRRGRRPAHDRHPAAARSGVAGAACSTCPSMQSSRCIFGDVSYRLPDVLIAGATWHLRPGLEVSAMVRWLWLHVHDRIDVRLSGPTLDAARHARSTSSSTAGSTTSGTRACASRTGGASGCASARCCALETSAVDTSAVNAAAVDGFKVEPVGLVELRLLRADSGSAAVTASPSCARVDGHRLRLRAGVRHALRRVGQRRPRRPVACQARLAGQRAPDRRRDTTRRARRTSA